MSRNSQPLAEVFGFPITDTSDEAKRHRENKLCPYNNIIPRCTKNSKTNPLGVCSLYHRNSPVIICPVRFRQDWKIISDAAEFIFPQGANWTHLGERRLKDVFGKSTGNIDYVLVSHDEQGKILDFGSLEVQSVYISGNLTTPFDLYINTPDPKFEWEGSNYPNPDYLSSSRKRLLPQIVAKGSILKQWGKKQVVALQTTFYDTLPKLPEVDPAHSDFAFFLYDLEQPDSSNTFEFKKKKVIYTTFEETLFQLQKFEAGPIENFNLGLQKSLDLKRAGIEDTSETQIIVE